MTLFALVLCKIDLFGRAICPEEIFEDELVSEF